MAKFETPYVLTFDMTNKGTISNANQTYFLVK